MTLLQSLDKLLKSSGWERDKSVPGYPAINPYGKDDVDFSVPVGFNVGVQISFLSEEDVNILGLRQISDLSQYMKAAIALHQVLSSKHRAVA